MLERQERNEESCPLIIIDHIVNIKIALQYFIEVEEQKPNICVYIVLSNYVKIKSLFVSGANLSSFINHQPRCRYDRHDALQLLQRFRYHHYQHDLMHYKHPLVMTVRYLDPVKCS
jgi:hypothetical protein